MPLFNFSLKTQNEKLVKFSELRGKKFFLSFHPLAWTPVCSRQMQDLDRLYDAFIDKGIVPFGVSVDSLYCKKPWAESLGLKRLELLADFWPHGALAKEMKCFIESAGISGRANYLINEEGEVCWEKIHEIKEQPDFDAILKEI